MTGFTFTPTKNRAGWRRCSSGYFWPGNLARTAAELGKQITFATTAITLLSLIPFYSILNMSEPTATDTRANNGTKLYRFGIRADERSAWPVRDGFEGAAIHVVHNTVHLSAGAYRCRGSRTRCVPAFVLPIISE